MKKEIHVPHRNSREGLGFYQAPTVVPQRITPRQAIEAFDRGQSRVYVVPTRTFVFPEDLKIRHGYSYHRDNWWKNIVPQAERAQWTKAGLFVVWDRILTHARRQCLRAVERRGRSERHLDFYHFIEPEVQKIQTTTPDSQRRRFELRFSVTQDYYYFNEYRPK